MKLNTELFNLLRALGVLLLKDDNVEDSISLFVKTPNILYGTYGVSKSNNGDVLVDVTESLSEDQYKALRATMGQVYFDYFNHYHEQFNNKYYIIMYSYVNGSWEPITVDKTNDLPN